MGMLLWKHFAVLDGLDGGMIMILVHLTIDGCLCLFMAVLGDSLLGDSGSNFLMDCRIMVTSLVPEKKGK